jgi:molybdate transport system permease protein
VTRTASIGIYDQVQALNYAGANSMALLLLLFSFVVMALVYGLNRNGLGRRAATIVSLR